MSLLSVENLSIAYQTRSGPALAVDDVSFHLEKGESLGIVGESGCGKTTIGMGLLRLLPPNGRMTRGSVWFDGIDLRQLSEESMQALRWERISMVFQAAMNAWNPVQRVGDQIIEAIRTHNPKISKKAAAEQVAGLYEAVDIPVERLFDYPHEYSGGMKQRAIIAMALACDPELVIADEPTTALDVIVQDQIVRKLKSIQKERNIAVIFISHDIGVVAEVCHWIRVMYKGRIVEAGSREEVFSTPAHPYTQALLSSYLTIDGVLNVERKRRESPPFSSMESLGRGLCGYLPHCRLADAQCRTLPPEWRRLTDTHHALCRICGECAP
jgi:peptide/nickel transport system ATP-binding protein